MAAQRLPISAHAKNIFNQLCRSNTIIAATDGGSEANGTDKCIATYGVCILHPRGADTIINFAERWKYLQSVKQKGKRQANIREDDIEVYDFNGTITNLINGGGIDHLRALGIDSYKQLDSNGTVKLPIFDGRTTITPTNNRGELTAILVALDKIVEEALDGDVVILSDSKYSISAIDIWSRNWFKNPAKHSLSAKENLDLVAAGQTKIDKLRTTRKVNCEHIRSHKQPPNIDAEPMEWLKWYLNDRADILAGIGLKK